MTELTKLILNGFLLSVKLNFIFLSLSFPHIEFEEQPNTIDLVCLFEVIISSGSKLVYESISALYSPFTKPRSYLKLKTDIGKPMSPESMPR